ncbi:MAG: hypothetical protein ACD_48C00512G0002 [uncultured bacterium]|nr:MAG: hypothetical protein ACD_48C00512G0002 [uncultured bacterium]
MKYISIILLSIIVIIILMFIITTPTVNKLSYCLNEYNISMNNTLVASRSEKWSKEKACEEGKPILQMWSACNASVQQQSLIPIALVYKIAKIIKPKIYNEQGVIRLHNDMCVDYPDTIIGR